MGQFAQCAVLLEFGIIGLLPNTTSDTSCPEVAFAEIGVVCGLALVTVIQFVFPYCIVYSTASFHYFLLALLVDQVIISLTCFAFDNLTIQNIIGTSCQSFAISFKQYKCWFYTFTADNFISTMIMGNASINLIFTLILMK